MAQSESRDLLTVNRLTYQPPAELSVATYSSQFIDQFQKTVYSNGEEMIVESNLGNNYVDGDKSYLQFTLTDVLNSAAPPVVPPAAPELGCGSALSFIREFLLIVNGKEVSRLQTANLFNNIKARWRHDKDWIKTTGGAVGFSDTLTTSQTNGQPIVVATGYNQYTIPLKYLCPVFDNGKLLPPQMMKDCRIQLILENPSTVFRTMGANAADVVASYKITNPVIVWESVRLGDAFANELNMISARQGLSIPHIETVNQQQSITGGSTLNVQVSASVSRSYSLAMITRRTADVKSVVRYADSMGSEPFDYTSVQARISDLYFPMRPIITEATRPVPLYMHSLSAVGYLKDKSHSSPSVGVMTAAGQADYKFGSVNALGQNLTSVHFNLLRSGAGLSDGYVINSSAKLTVDIEWGTPQDRRVDLYLSSLKLATYFGNNVKVQV